MVRGWEGCGAGQTDEGWGEEVRCVNRAAQHLDDQALIGCFLRGLLSLP